MQTGKVKHWNVEKGYGFVMPDAGGPDLFVHISALPDDLDDLKVGQRVRFQEMPSRKKVGSYEACEIELV